LKDGVRSERRSAKRRSTKRRSVYTFSTGVRQGDARAPGALSRILKSKRLPIYHASGKQVHGTRIQIVSKLQKSKEFLGTDGFLTDSPDQPLAIFTADCVPIFLSAEDGQVVGLLHAGWRGVQGKILPRALKVLRERWGIKAAQVTAWAGPHIGPCCFEVNWDVARRFPLTRKRSGDRWTVDLEKELRRQARQRGARWTSKKPFEGCTMHQSRFYSYRRDQTPKRQVSIIMKHDIL
jgi:YfiH family protein